jgi:hypothetical protein
MHLTNGKLCDKFFLLSSLSVRNIMELLALLDKRIVLRISGTVFQPHQSYLTGKILNLHFMTLEGKSSDLKLYLMVHGLSLTDNQFSVSISDKDHHSFISGEEVETRVGNNLLRIRLI